ncbi:hypothetical protein BH24ACT6_BH24ACT6_05900 [soil metagenome]
MHASIAIVAADGETYLIYALIALLAVVGFGMAVLTVWLVRVTKPEHEALSALGVMGSRRFRKEGTVARERHIATIRGVPGSPNGDGEQSDERSPDSDEKEEEDATGAIPRVEDEADGNRADTLG